MRSPYYLPCKPAIHNPYNIHTIFIEILVSMQQCSFMYSALQDVHVSWIIVLILVSLSPGHVLGNNFNKPLLLRSQGPLYSNTISGLFSCTNVLLRWFGLYSVLEGACIHYNFTISVRGRGSKMAKIK